MPLQQLVEYFNDRFGIEHHSNFRPIILDEGIASGLFGPIRITSRFSSLRLASKPEIIKGYAAQIDVATYDPLLLQEQQLDCLVVSPKTSSSNFESIINFDRLARTVHMLNYLPISHLQQTLFLDVDPRHILGVKSDHGAYFEEVITRCGLETHNVVIVIGVNAYGSKYYSALQRGLDNYRQRGYQIGLRFNYVAPEALLTHYLVRLVPEFALFSAGNLAAQIPPALLVTRLQEIKASVAAVKGQIILQQIEDQSFDQLAREHEIDWVEGKYYHDIHVEYRQPLNLENQNSPVFSYS